MLKHPFEIDAVASWHGKSAVLVSQRLQFGIMSKQEILVFKFFKLRVNTSIIPNRGTKPYGTIQYSTVQYNTIQYNLIHYLTLVVTIRYHTIGYKT